MVTFIYVDNSEGQSHLYLVQNNFITFLFSIQEKKNKLQVRIFNFYLICSPAKYYPLFLGTKC